MRKIKGTEVKNSRQLYNKLFFIYTAVIVSVVTLLMLFFISSTRSRYLENNLAYMKKMHAEVLDYLTECRKTADYLHGELYHSDMEMSDLQHYLTDSPEEYQKYRLDTYADYRLKAYKGIDAFIADAFEAYDALEWVTLVSYSKGDVTYFKGTQNIYHRADGSAVLRDIENNNLAGNGRFSFLKEIRDPVSRQSLGAMIVTFDTKRIGKIREYYSEAEVLLYDDYKTAVYDSAGGLKPSEIEKAREAGGLERFLGAYVQEAQAGNCRLVSYIGKKKAAEVPAVRVLMIVGTALALLTLGERGVAAYLRRLSKRLNRILDGMAEVMDGNLKVRLPADANGDELDLIAYHFNEMCEKLNLHIQKSYLAEIEQKNAEMAALQSQINPHFLYNTLEAIRMKAICNGDREVGKMLYSMAVTFRSQIKEADVITLAQELHYCKKYLELFEYRYLNQFKSEVVCPVEDMKVPIIKFVLQPIIENYFIHGLRNGDTDNFIKITAARAEDGYELCVEDNGQGMPEAEIERKNRELRENKMDQRESIGVTNVNRRLKAVYGSACGVRMEARRGGGLRVILRFRPEEGGIDEESNAGRG